MGREGRDTLGNRALPLPESFGTIRPWRQSPDMSGLGRLAVSGPRYARTFAQVGQSFSRGRPLQWQREPAVSAHFRSSLPSRPHIRPKWQRGPDMSTHIRSLLPSLGLFQSVSR